MKQTHTMTENIKSIIDTLCGTKEIRRGTLAYNSALHAINNPGEKIYTGANTGSGRFSSSKSWTSQTAKALTLIGVEHITGNDAPRNGKAGEWIMVTNKSL